MKYKRNKRIESSISRNIRNLYFVRILNISFQKYKKVPLYQGSEYTFPKISGNKEIFSWENVTFSEQVFQEKIKEIFLGEKFETEVKSALGSLRIYY